MALHREVSGTDGWVVMASKTPGRAGGGFVRTKQQDWLGWFGQCRKIPQDEGSWVEGCHILLRVPSSTGAGLEGHPSGDTFYGLFSQSGASKAWFLCRLPFP